MIFLSINNELNKIGHLRNVSTYTTNLRLSIQLNLKEGSKTYKLFRNYYLHTIQHYNLVNL